MSSTITETVTDVRLSAATQRVRNQSADFLLRRLKLVHIVTYFMLTAIAVKVALVEVGNW